MRERQEADLKRLVVTQFFKYSDHIFLALFLAVPFAVLAANFVLAITPYQNIMLVVGATQAIITGYLSFKIFEVSKRDSELPVLAYEIVGVEEVPSPYEDHSVVRCTVRIGNRSFGRAKIKDIGIDATFDEALLREHKTPGEGRILAGFPEGRPIPTILDKGEYVDIMFQINGFGYLDSVTLNLEDDAMGAQDIDLMVSEISNRLAMQRWSDKADDDADDADEE